MYKKATYYLIIASLFFIQNALCQKLSLIKSWETESNVVNQQLGEWVHMAGDLNGDGYSDLVAKSVNVSPGYNIYYGNASGGFSFTPDLKIFATGPIGGYENFGGIGDLNKDGFNDLVIGNPDESACSIFYGKSTGISSTPDLKIPGSSPTGKMGYSLDISGDLNNDGFNDLVVSEPYVTKPGNPNVYGKIYVYHGSASGISSIATTEYFTYVGYTYFGTKVKYAGDVNNDGFDDLLIGTTDVPSTIGYPYVLLMKGSATGLITTGSYSWSDMGSLQNDPNYARAIGSAGDLNNDGYDDIFVSDTKYNGMVKIFLGTATGPSGNAVGLYPPSGTNSNSLFGYSVTKVGDFNSDGFNDLAVSLPQYGTSPLINQGRILVYLGNSTGINSTPYYSYETNIAGSKAAYVSFAGDLNHDGFNDLIAGCPQLSNGEAAEGRIMVLKGQSTIYADFTVNKTKDCLYNNLIQFTNTSAPETTSWQWDFGDGTSSTLPSPQHTYNVGGIYTVTLTVKNVKNHSHTKVSSNLIFIQKPLNAGTYTVGPGGNFTNIQMLNDSIKCGIGGNVVIRFKDGTYDELLKLDNLYKQGTNQKIQFESESGNAASVIIGNIYINNTDSISFKNLTFYNAVISPGIPTIDILSSSDISIKNCKVLHSQNSTNHIRGVGVDRMVVEQNIFSYMPDSSAEGTEYMQVIQLNNSSTINILKNTFVLVPGNAIYIQNTNQLYIRENLIYGKYLTGKTADGFYLTGINGLTIERNKLFKLIRGISIFNSQGNGNDNIISNNVIGRGLGSPTAASETYDGIKLSGSSNFKIFHNSINYDQPGQAYGGVNVASALNILNCSSIIIRNNILRSTKTYNAALTILPFTNSIESDYNFISGYIKVSNQSYAYPGTYGDLRKWINFSKLDYNSFEGTVTFDSEMKVTSDPKYLNESGFFINEVPVDIEGNARGPISTDIGAYNISGTPTFAYNSRNLALIKISPKNLNLGNNFFSIDVANLKEVTADLVYCSYQVDGGAVVTETWNTNLSFKDTLTYTFNTPFVLTRERLYNVKAWVSAQLPPTDIHLYNDTLTSEAVIKMKGIYTVYGNNPDYTDIKTANYHLTQCKVDGQVIFNLRPGDQRNVEMFTVAEGPVVYQSETGKAEDIKIKIQNIRNSYITFKHLTIFAEINTETNYNYKGVEIYGSKEVTVDSCIITATSALRTGFNTLNTTNVKFTNSQFKNLNAGIYFSAQGVYGNTAYYGSHIVENCVFDSVKAPVRIAGRWYWPNSLSIKNNIMNKPENGIYFEPFSIDNISIEGNRIVGVTKSAIETYGTNLSNTKIFNNYIETKFLSIYLYGTTSDTKIYNNRLISPSTGLGYQLINGKREDHSMVLYLYGTYSNFEFMHNNCIGGIAFNCNGTLLSYNNNFYSVHRLFLMATLIQEIK